MSGEITDGAPSPCGHHNPPNHRFCEICGVSLVAQCPRCQTITRANANFCGSCGFNLREPTQVAGDHRALAQAVPVVAPPAIDTPLKAVLAEVPPAVDVGDDSNEALLRFLDRRREGVDRRRRLRRRVLGAGAAAITVAVLIAGIVWWSQQPSETTARTTPTSSVFAVMAPSPAGQRTDPAPAQIASNVDAPAVPDPVKATDARGSKPVPLSASGAASIGSDVQREALDQRTAADAAPPAKQDGGDTGGSQAQTPGSSVAVDKPAVAVPEKPRAGGELVFVVPGEPPSYDAHREETFALIHPAAPHYNTLLRIDPFDKTGTRVASDLAESFAVSPDKRTYVFKLRRGVKFHDGSEMTSRDVKATYDKIISPPPGVISSRKGEYLEIETVQAPERYVVAFKLKWPSPSFIHSLASPWNWIYKADILERDIRWYEKNIMGTGPFLFVEHVRGSHWVARRNPEYWNRGKPYLDGYRALFIRDDTAQVAAIRAERAHIQFRGFSPGHRDDIVRTLGDKVTVQESPWNCGLVVTLNHEKKPFDDRRMRRALTLALDRHQAATALSRIAIVRDVAGVQVPATPFATPLAELTKLAGYGRDIKKARAEAKRLLADAGVGAGASFVLKNRNIPMPYEYIGTWLLDQWRQVGLTVRHEIQDSSLYFRDLRSGNYELSTDFQCGYVVDPDLDLYKFQSHDRSPANFGRYSDPVLDDLYVQQSRTVDPEERRRLIRAFEKRLLDDEAHYIYTLQWHRIIPHSARVRGWTITPSHYVNQQLDTVWLAQ